MVTLSHTQSAASLISDINANLQSMGSVVVLTAAASASQVVAALNAEFANVSGTTELSTSMTAAAFIEALNTNFSLADGGVKEQYIQKVSDTVAKVNSLAQSGDLVFILVTDIHYGVTLDDPAPAAARYHFDDTVVNMKAVANDSDIDALYCLGDIIDGRTVVQDSKDEAQLLMAKMNSVGLPVFVAIGNHDNNRNGNGSSYPVISRSDMQAMFQDRMSQDVTFMANSYKACYYKDYADKGLRVIVIYGNSGANGAYLYDVATREFLGSSIESMPNGYKAVVVTHVPPMSKMNFNSTARSGGESGDTTINGVTISGGVKGVIQRYGDKVIAMFYGHCHQDNVWADPFVCIGTCCNKCVAVNDSSSKWSEDAVMPTRSANDATADLWDVVLVKPTAKVIEMVRFGAGADRTIHYEPIECAAGASVTLTSKINGGEWGLRTSDQGKASVANGMVTVGSGIASGTLLSVWCKSSDWSVNSSKQLTAGTAVEYWTIKVM